ncbi:hypothetical protein [Haloarchaeobius sp. DFWS5]|uniref:hypothetical protein n=1 Tax=Haloarchaeobius sp. DFWS5 TaxID=3446114 RepID=UPI003EBDF7EB
MTDESDTPTWTRRAILAGAAGTVATTAAIDTVTAQSSRQFVFEEPSDFSGEYEGSWLVVVDQTDGDASAADQCRDTTWSPDERRTYEAVLTTRLAQNPEDSNGAEVTVVSSATDDDIQPGTVYTISSATECSSGYVTVDAEFVPDEQAPYGTETTVPTDPGAGSGPIPGFTGAGALAAVAGLAGLARWRD